MELNLDTINIHRPSDYAAHGFPWSEWDLLRRDAPIFWYERADIEPFWAVTRYADIMTVSNHPDIFINGGPRLRLTLKGKPEMARAGLDDFGTQRGWDPDEPPDLVFMDNPRHRHMRKLSSWAYTQGGMRKMRPHFETLANDFTAMFIDELRERSSVGETHDFIDGLACKLPLAAVGEIMGLARDDWKQILIWSNALVGDIPPAHRLTGESNGAAGYRYMYEFRSYLEDLIQESRKVGAERGGFIDRMVHTQVQGEYLNDQQLIGYLFLLTAAGNDTTRNAFSGGVEALLQHPAEREKLIADPSLLDSAVEEILRWTSPVGSFLRTTTEDFQLGDTLIKAGDTVGLFYPSANRDETVFDDPYRFDITRTPNPHLTFGFGAHFCLGTNLARAELAASIKALLPYLDELEIHGIPRRLEQTHVLGYTYLPMRVKAAAD